MITKKREKSKCDLYILDEKHTQNWREGMLLS